VASSDPDDSVTGDGVSPYHEGELAVQRRAGVVSGAAKVGGIIHSEIPPVAAAFLAQRSYVFLGAEAGDGRVWATLVAGPPGFALASEPSTVVLSRGPARSDPLQGLGLGSAVGLLAIDLVHRKRMRVNGRVGSVGSPLTVHVTEAYANCPKYIQARLVKVAPDLGSGTVTTAVAVTPDVRATLASADTFFIATVHPERGADVSHRGGPPGFVTVEEDGSLTWPDYAGNMMFNTLGNIAVDPRAGLLFLDYRGGRTVQLTGAATIDWERDIGAVPGAERFVRFVPERVVIRQGALTEEAFLGRSPHNPDGR
jgi:hypothetical protein